MWPGFSSSSHTECFDRLSAQKLACIDRFGIGKVQCDKSESAAWPGLLIDWCIVEKSFPHDETL